MLCQWTLFPPFEESTCLSGEPDFAGFGNTNERIKLHELDIQKYSPQLLCMLWYKTFRGEAFLLWSYLVSYLDLLYMRENKGQTTAKQEVLWKVIVLLLNICNGCARCCGCAGIFMYSSDTRLAVADRKDHRIEFAGWLKSRWNCLVNLHSQWVNQKSNEKQCWCRIVTFRWHEDTMSKSLGVSFQTNEKIGHGTTVWDQCRSYRALPQLFHWQQLHPYWNSFL